MNPTSCDCYYYGGDTLYNVYRIDASHYQAIQRLYRRCFGLRRSWRYIARKYKTCIGYIAYVDGVPVAAYSVFEQDVRIGIVTYHAAQSADTMTDPQHRGRGLFMFLANKTYKEAALEDIAFVFGFPNSQSLPGFKKLGWQFTGQMKKLQIKVNTLPIAEICYWLNIPYRFTFSDFTGDYSVNNHLLAANLNEWFTEAEIIGTVRNHAFWTGCRRAVIVCSDNSEDYLSLKHQAWTDANEIGYFPLNKDPDFRPVITYDMIDTWR